MNKHKIVTILGARPQFIKASAVSAAIAALETIEEVVVHTGQHFDANMSEVFFSELGMDPPTYHLGIHGGGHGEMTGRMLTAIEAVLQAENPSAVMVYGDTNSTLAGALAAIKLHIPVAHVEAGLRSFNLESPEEINRMLTDRVARWLFTPTESASAELRREGTAPGKIFQVGDVMYDVALQVGSRERTHSGEFARLAAVHRICPQQYCLTTIHRAENTDNLRRLKIIVESVCKFSHQIPVVWPMHPRTEAALKRYGMFDELAKVAILVDPLGYIDMAQFQKNAALIVTDSGGVQKEAFFHRVPCVTLRNETEWTELMEAGWNRLAPPHDTEELLHHLRAALGTHGSEVSPYGNGDSALKIANVLSEDLCSLNISSSFR